MHCSYMPNDVYCCDECEAPANPYVAVGARNGKGGTYMIRLCRPCAYQALTMLDRAIGERRVKELAEWEARR